MRSVSLRSGHAHLALTVLLPALVAHSQSTARTALRRELPGTVTGHVTLDDTGGPARFAAVTLQPVVAPTSPTAHPGDEPPVTVSRVVHTTLDGSFVLAGVAPGNYYVLADADAYLSAAGLLTRDQMDHPTPAIARRMAQLLVPVTIASGRTSIADVRLHRGASLSGTVRFDDGTPFHPFVNLLRKDDHGDWKRFQPHLAGSENNFIDDRGQFRIVGLPAGDYRVLIYLSVAQKFISRRGDDNQGFYSSSLYTLKIYSPDAIREKDAKTYTLTDGQDETGVQIEVPLSKLHSISGALVEQNSGRPINAGHVALLFPDNNDELASVDISPDDNAFHLAFVPEGTYTLKVTDAQNVERTVTPAPPGEMPYTNTKLKVLQTFGDTTQPLIVTTDVPNLLIAVPPAGQTTNTTASDPANTTP